MAQGLAGGDAAAGQNASQRVGHAFDLRQRFGLREAGDVGDISDLSRLQNLNTAGAEGNK